MTASVHLVKLCVGLDDPADLAAWQAAAAARRAAAGADPRPVHVTRMWPRRGDDLVRGGSLYWVFRGTIRARQRIIELLPRIGEDGISRCAIVLEPEIVRTVPQPRRPFQGWRYLRPEDTPRDLPSRPGDALPDAMMADLAALGVL
jgi:hypothetical protein